MARTTGAILQCLNKKKKHLHMFISDKATAPWIPSYMTDIWTDNGFNCFDTKTEKKSPAALAPCYNEWLSFCAGAQSCILRRCNTLPADKCLTWPYSPKYWNTGINGICLFWCVFVFSKCASHVIDASSVYQDLQSIFKKKKRKENNRKCLLTTRSRCPSKMDVLIIQRRTILEI